VFTRIYHHHHQGFATAKQFAQLDARVICVTRNEERGQSTVSALQQIVPENKNISYIAMDLNDLNQVKHGIEQIQREYSELHYLINNAGFGMVGPERMKELPASAQNIESHFQVNYLSHFYLSNELLSMMEQSCTDQAQSRITNISSKTHYFVSSPNILNLELPQTPEEFYTPVRQKEQSLQQILEKTEPWTSEDFNQLQYYATNAYAVSKLAQIVFTKELQRRLTEQKSRIITNVMHPGAVATNFYQHFGRDGLMNFLKTINMLKSPNYAAKHLINVAANPKFDDCAGDYFNLSKKRSPSELAKSPELAKKLWNLSEELINTRLTHKLIID
jgi:NAD(P)-dependent dehydrogenase (short-subunit alcohol dehydrogenase family)